MQLFHYPNWTWVLEYKDKDETRAVQFQFPDDSWSNTVVVSDDMLLEIYVGTGMILGHAYNGY